MLKKWFGKKTEPEPETPASPAEGVDETAAANVEATEGAGAVATEPPESPTAEAPATKSRWALFKDGLAKTRKGLKSLFSLRRALNDAYLDEIEEGLYNADFGPRVVSEITDGLRTAWKEKQIERAEDVRAFLCTQLKEMLTRRSNQLIIADSAPTVVLVAGVNGTGKTTSIAKLSKRLTDSGKKVILAAGDTFRAAAVEQLTIWSERLGVEIVTGDTNADPASVAYRGAEAAVERKADVLIVDTAGRLHTQRNLMRELEKIRTVLAKKIPGAPHECLLVLDATTGQNGLTQAREFQEAVKITGIVLAKLDGTAKGGIVVTINNELEIPVKLVGLGEGIDDMQPFDVDGFVEALFEADGE